MTVRETWAEILEGGYRVLWVTMDEEQATAFVRYVKSYIGETTSDGVRMTWGRFAAAVGTTDAALRSYYQRSEATSTRSSTSTPVEIRRLKSAILSTPGGLEHVVSDPQVRARVFEALDKTEREPVSRPSTAVAQPSTSQARNISALARLANMHTAAQEANELADFGSLSDHQRANAEVALRATESEIAMWRENAGGGISDEAIQALMAQGA